MRAVVVVVSAVLGRALGVLARLGWRRRERSPRSDEDGLSGPTTTAEQSGGLTSRGSLLRKLRDVAG